MANINWMDPDFQKRMMEGARARAAQIQREKEEQALLDKEEIELAKKQKEIELLKISKEKKERKKHTFSEEEIIQRKIRAQNNFKKTIRPKYPELLGFDRSGYNKQFYRKTGIFACAFIRPTDGYKNAMKIRLATDFDYVEKNKAALVARNKDPEFQARAAAARRIAEMLDPSIREKNKQMLIARNKDPEFKAKIAEKLKKRNADPEYRKKLSEAVKAGHARKKGKL